MREKLLPCPFCGNHPAISDETTAEGIVVFVHCEYCATHERDVTSYSTAWDSNDAEQDAIWKCNNRVCPKEVQEAIEKQKPKKPTNKQIEGIGDCPMCKSSVLSQLEYCLFCGQKLDWSEE